MTKTRIAGLALSAVLAAGSMVGCSCGPNTSDCDSDALVAAMAKPGPGGGGGGGKGGGGSKPKPGGGVKKPAKPAKPPKKHGVDVDDVAPGQGVGGTRYATCDEED